MASRSDIQCNNITSSKRLKKKSQGKKQLHKMFELENSSQTQSRNILEIVKRNILMCHQNKLHSEDTSMVKFPAVENRLQEQVQREPFTDQKNICYTESRSASFECSSTTKQLLRKSILEKRKERSLHDVQTKEKFINYDLWRPW